MSSATKFKYPFKSIVIVVLLYAMPVTLFADAYDDGLAAFKGKDFAAAREIWSAENLKDDARAQFSLGRLYMRGLGVLRNYETGVSYYRRATEMGYISAQFNLGLAYFQGFGVKKDVLQAKALWEDAGRKGHGLSQFNVGALYWSGADIPQDQVAAMGWLKMALENGNKNAAGFLYSLYQPMYAELTKDQKLYRGINTSRTMSQVEEQAALKLASQSISQGEYNHAVEHLLALAEDGHRDSQFILGQMYEQGKGLKKDFSAALSWYETAAKAGHADAQYRMGLYHINEAPDPNQSLGLYWMQSAADNNSDLAMEFFKSGG